MKLICTDDWHLRSTKPENRIDDFFYTQYKKVVFIYNYALENNIQTILNGGDLFDIAIQPLKQMLKLINMYTELFLTYKNKGIQHLVVEGQHDQRYHSTDLTGTPIENLRTSGAIELMTKDCFMLDEETNVYGAGWGSEVPQVEDPDAFNILLTHRMVVHEKLWFGQDGEERANILLRKYPDYSLIVSGDNHQTLTGLADGAWLINAGSIMRQGTDQTDHRPCFYVFDTFNGLLEQIFIPCEKSSLVFDLKKVEREKKKNEELLVYKEELKKDMETSGLDFSLDLKNAFDKTKPDSVDQSIMQEILEGATNG